MVSLAAAFAAFLISFLDACYVLFLAACLRDLEPPFSGNVERRNSNRPRHPSGYIRNHNKSAGRSPCEPSPSFPYDAVQRDRPLR